jgi:AmiR/NasT family two-component response regulator
MGPMSTGPMYDYSPEVNQAAGMVSVQANCRIEEAFVLLFERADSAGLPIQDIASAVLDHSISFAD